MTERKQVQSLATDPLFPRETFRGEIVPRLGMRSLTEDLAEFSGLSADEVVRRADTAIDDLHQVWRARQPSLDDAAVREVYRQCATGYLFKWANGDRYRYTKYARIRPLLHGTTLLDYGTATGCMALFASRLDGFAVTAADIDTPYFAFARFRFAKYGGVTPLATEREEVPRGAFDTVICLDVLEHIVDWRAALDTCLAARRPGGRLLLDVAYDRYDDGALHISDRTGLTAVALAAHLADRGARVTGQVATVSVIE